MKKTVWTPEEITVVDLTAEEIAQSEADATAISEMETQRQADIDAKETLKANAKAKLIAGEALTEDEANTIVL
ncbi:hypothetical protein N9T79_01580 [Candidatus Pelagibacter sp.]|jgi:hypothetical protein|nr:hypothetical protein [Candidatus Pelagibacter sp.]